MEGLAKARVLLRCFFLVVLVEMVEYEFNSGADKDSLEEKEDDNDEAVSVGIRCVAVLCKDGGEGEEPEKEECKTPNTSYHSELSTGCGESVSLGEEGEVFHEYPPGQRAVAISSLLLEVVSYPITGFFERSTCTPFRLHLHRDLLAEIPYPISQLSSAGVFFDPFIGIGASSSSGAAPPVLRMCSVTISLSSSIAVVRWTDPRDVVDAVYDDDDEKAGEGRNAFFNFRRYVTFFSEEGSRGGGKDTRVGGAACEGEVMRVVLGGTPRVASILFPRTADDEDPIKEERSKEEPDGFPRGEGWLPFQSHLSCCIRGEDISDGGRGESGSASNDKRERLEGMEWSWCKASGRSGAERRVTDGLSTRPPTVPEARRRADLLLLATLSAFPLTSSFRSSRWRSLSLLLFLAFFSLVSCGGFSGSSHSWEEVFSLPRDWDAGPFSSPSSSGGMDNTSCSVEETEPSWRRGEGTRSDPRKVGDNAAWIGGSKRAEDNDRETSWRCSLSSSLSTRDIDSTRAASLFLRGVSLLFFTGAGFTFAVFFFLSLSLVLERSTNDGLSEEYIKENDEETEPKEPVLTEGREGSVVRVRERILVEVNDAFRCGVSSEAEEEKKVVL